MEKILEKLKSGAKLTQQENEELIVFMGQLEDPSTVPEDKTEEFLNAQELSSEMGKSLEDYFKSPEAIKARKTAEKQLKASKLSGDVAQAMQIGLSVSDFITGNKQVRQSNKALGKLNRPGIPTPPLSNPNLQNALASSERGIANAGQNLAPAELQILDQYFKDIGTAKTASTGQASNFGSLAQLASLRRNRSSQQLVPLVEQSRNNAIGIRNSLLGLQQQETQNRFGNEMSAFSTLEDRYNQDEAAFAGLGQAGRINRLQGLSNIANNLPNIIGSASTLFENSGQSTGFGPEIDDYSNNIDANLYSRFSKNTRLA